MRHSFTRRDFLASASVTAATLGTANLCQAQAPRTPKTFKMKFGFMTSMAQDMKLPALTVLSHITLSA